MPKRITLKRLISYTSNCSQKYSYSDNAEDVRPLKIDSTQFFNLDHNKVENVNNFPKKLKNILHPFTKKIHRNGVIKHSADKKNISLFYSILFCIDDDFNNLNMKQKKKYIHETRNKMLIDLKNCVCEEFDEEKNKMVRRDRFDKSNYKSLQWNKKELRTKLTEYDNCWMILRLLADYFFINIFILDVYEDKLYAVYPEEFFNMYKMNVFMSVYDEIFEPLTYKKCKLWNYNVEPFKKIINVEKSYIIPQTADLSKNAAVKLFQSKTEDLDKYIVTVENKDNNFEEIATSETENAISMENTISTKSSMNVFCKKDVISNSINNDSGSDSETESDQTISKSNSASDTDTSDSDSDSVPKYDDIRNIATKIKLSELQDMAKKYAIDIENGKTKKGKIKYKTKALLKKGLTKLLKRA